jgi:hypothetical protein
MRIGLLIGFLILTFVLLISYFLAYNILSLFGEKIEDFSLLNRYIIFLFMPHYMAVFNFFILFNSSQLYRNFLDIIKSSDDIQFALISFFGPYVGYNIVLALALFRGQGNIPVASLSMLSVISLIGLVASIYFGISLDKFVKNIKNKRKGKGNN